jgi:MoaA/NifB/PqqE/SkfB family radical SAM enzyme
VPSLPLVNHPVLGNYYLTYRCNARCHFCDIPLQPSPYADTEAVAANLRDMKRLGIRVVDFTGGEPLLHRQLPSFLAQAQSLDMVTTITTNCLLYPKYAERLQGLVDMLHFSLDAPDRETHDAIRGVKCYDHVLRSIDLALELGERPDILYTVTPDNLAGIEQVYRQITRPKGLILILNPVFGYNEVGEELTAQQLKSLKRWGKMPGIYLNEGFVKLRENGGNKTEDPVCKAGSTTVVVSPHNGILLPCYHAGLYEVPIGASLYDTWHSEAVQRWIRLEGRLPICEGCTINCYMQPTFATHVSSYFFQALPSTLKYSFYKWTRWGQLQPRAS